MKYRRLYVFLVILLLNSFIFFPIINSVYGIYYELTEDFENWNENEWTIIDNPPYSNVSVPEADAKYTGNYGSEHSTQESSWAEIRKNITESTVYCMLFYWYCVAVTAGEFPTRVFLAYLENAYAERSEVLISNVSDTNRWGISYYNDTGDWKEEMASSKPELVIGKWYKVLYAEKKGHGDGWIKLYVDNVVYINLKNLNNFRNDKPFNLIALTSSAPAPATSIHGYFDDFKLSYELPIPPNWLDLYFMFGVGIAGLILMIFAPTWVGFGLRRKSFDPDKVERIGIAFLLFCIGYGLFISWLAS